MTEAEARKRWCPVARIDPGYNREPAHFLEGAFQAAWNVSCACMASRCMAWRWFDKAKGDGFCGLAWGRDD